MIGIIIYSNILNHRRNTDIIDIHVTPILLSSLRANLRFPFIVMEWARIKRFREPCGSLIVLVSRPGVPVFYPQRRSSINVCQDQRGITQLCVFIELVGHCYIVCSAMARSDVLLEGDGSDVRYVGKVHVELVVFGMARRCETPGAGRVR